MTKREFDGLRTDILNQFAEMRKEIQAMLPRELYDVRHKEMVEDIAELKARASKAEQMVIELNTQLLSVKQTTPAAISSSALQVRNDAMKSVLDVVKNAIFIGGGALLTWIAYGHH